MFSLYQFAPPEAVPAKTLRSKGHCCKNTCIHCPYGHTVKKFGLKFHSLSQDNLEIARKIKGTDLSFDEFPIENYFIVTLKEFYCAVIRVDKLFVREFYLLDDFKDQQLSKELVESYFFC